MRTLSIIGIALFSFMFILSVSAIGDLSSDLDELEEVGSLASLFSNQLGDALTEFSNAVYGLGGLSMFSNLFGLAFSIVMFVKTGKQKSVKADAAQQLLQLAALRDKGLLTDDELEAKKRELMI